MKKTCLLLFAAVLCSRILAQSNVLNPALQEVFPPAPNASALGKFGAVPVGPSTGIPSVNVPLYQYNDARTGLQLAVSLDYHAGGVRVDEIASNVGIGWALNAGGVISRSVRGIYDEMPVVGFINNTLPYTEDEGNWHSSPLERPFNRIADRKLDGQNDIFSFNFNGRSGRFVLGRNNDFLMLDQQKLRVEKTISAVTNTNLTLITKFVIIDERGFRYTFDATEMTYISGGPINGAFTSSWYLTSIEAPSRKDKITFSYEDASYEYQTGFSVSEAIPITLDGIGLVTRSQGATGFGIAGKRLKQIAFPDGGTVIFGYDTQTRQDLLGDRLLKKVSILADGKKSGYKLNQDYSLNRATLKAVVPVGGIEEIETPGYTFEYAGALPDRGTLYQDHWGFPLLSVYTGAIPEEWIRADGGEYPPYRKLNGGGSRDTHPEDVKLGSLTKINYPTGGGTIFEMEANQAKDSWLEPTKVTVALPPYSYQGQSIRLFCVDGSACTNSQPFTFNGENNTETRFEVVIPRTFGNCTMSGCAITLQILKPNGQDLMSPVTIPYVEEGSTTPLILSNLIKGETYQVVLNTYGLTGYEATVGISRREVLPGGFSEVVLRNAQPYVGGLRAKRISDYTENSSSPATVREYEYLLEDGVTSSGSLGVRPLYSTLVRYDFKIIMAVGDDRELYPGNFNPNFIVRTSSPVADLLYANGSAVTYKRIVEKILGASGQSAGKTVRWFTNFADSPVVIHDVFPFVPPAYWQWYYGLLLKEQVFDKSNILLKQTINEYDAIGDTYYNEPARFHNFRCISIAPVKFLWGGNGNAPKIDANGAPYYFLMSVFSPMAGRNHLVRSSVAEHHGPDSLWTETTYEYDQVNYYEKSTTTRNSKGEILKKELKYPKDMVDTGRDPSGVYAQMIQPARNIIAPVVEQIYSNNDNVLMLSRTNYYNPHVNVYVPQTVETKQGAAMAEIRLRYHKYDDRGNILVASQENGFAVGYKWRYDYPHPVAVGKNVSDNDFYIEDFEAATTHTDAYSHTGKFAYSGTYTPPFTAPAGRTYHISYWQLTDAKWIFHTEGYTGQAISGIIDDVRIYPTGALITTHTYEATQGVTAIMDVNNMTTHFDYDAFGRLQIVRDKDLNILKTYDYNYRVPGISGKDKNFVKNTVVQLEGVNDLNDIQGLTVGQILQVNQYLDGLGRPAQTVSRQASPGGKDIVNAIQYDEFGREAIKYLPYTSGEDTGWYKENTVNTPGNYNGSPHYNFYNTGAAAMAQDTKPYAETVFEASPLNRILKQGEPGETWRPSENGGYDDALPTDHSIKKAYVYNRLNEVILLDYDETTKRIGLSNDGYYYGANQLYVNKTKDEHNREVIEYIDKEGHTILKKVEVEKKDNGTKVFAETYYVYDDFGNLVTVLPPEAMERVKKILIPQP